MAGLIGTCPRRSLLNISNALAAAKRFEEFFDDASVGRMTYQITDAPERFASWLTPPPPNNHLKPSDDGFFIA